MLPNFLVIGAKKSGTSWLNKQLRHHPDIYLPPIKEIHYFDVVIPFFLPLFVQSLSPRRSTRYWMRNKIKHAFQDIQLNPQNIGWHAHYFLSPRTDKYYSSLFLPGDEQMAADNTPGYGQLDADRIAKIHALMPDIKIIYLLRNPIHRMWSDAAQFYSRSGYQGLHTIDEQRIIKFLRKEKHLRHSQYFTNLQRWENFYPKDKIFIGFFEQLRDNPHQLLKDIYEFLELDFSQKYIPDSVKQKVNARQYPMIPDYAAYYLAQKLSGEIERLQQRFDNEHTDSWLKYASSIKNNYRS